MKAAHLRFDVISIDDHAVQRLEERCNTLHDAHLRVNKISHLYPSRTVKIYEVHPLSIIGAGKVVDGCVEF